MKEFNLEEFKKDPSRQVVTRRGKTVRIICTDRKGKQPIVALIVIDREEFAYYYNKNGFLSSKQKESDFDLFFEE